MPCPRHNKRRGVRQQQRPRPRGVVACGRVRVEGEAREESVEAAANTRCLGCRVRHMIRIATARACTTRTLATCTTPHLVRSSQGLILAKLLAHVAAGA
jgi:hypothetical protein